MDVEGDEGAAVGADRVPGRPWRSTERARIIAASVAVVAALVGAAGVVGSSDTRDSIADGAIAGPSIPTVERTTVPQVLTATSRTSSTTTGSVSATSSTVASTTTVAVTAPELDDEPAVVARPIPVDPPPPPPAAPRAPWADSVVSTAGGHLSTDVGCARDLSASALDEFFSQRVGPVIGWDYQHVYPLGGGRSLWLFQDTFIDHSNTATSLDRASFAHNTALVQDGTCFRLLHGGTASRPTPFEPGTGTTSLATWFWPMGGEVHDGRLYVFWARMQKDPVDPLPPDGLGWHPDATFVGTYDPGTLERLDFRQATQGGATPIYGYAVQSQGDWTYLFGNTFEQNLAREGGWGDGPHSGTKMFLGRVPRGRIFDQPQYWTPGGWTADRAAAVPVLQRHWAEFPFQPRIIDGQWVAATAVDGYWGDRFELDVASDPWGPWTTVEQGALAPRGADPAMNTYHAHLMPWRDGAGQVVVAVSNNARNMLRDAWPNPSRYRPNLLSFAWRTPPPVATVPPATTTTSTTPPRPTTTAPPRTTTTTTTTTTIPRVTTTAPSTSSTVAPTGSSTTVDPPAASSTAPAEP
ncbi:hypothetical protein [Ilumatobacter sp.]|uniref:hypothetical protein n=1 Tax=Ilumatobacter sp. TaxID=1967498 RepID=UPI003C605ADF